MMSDIYESENIYDLLEDTTMILLGNGFDLASGLLTSYADFYRSEYFADFYRDEHRLEVVKNRSMLSDYILFSNISSDRWVDLELLLYDFERLYVAVQRDDESMIERLLPKEMLSGVIRLSPTSDLYREVGKLKESIGGYDEYVEEYRRCILDDLNGAKLKSSYYNLMRYVKYFIDDAIDKGRSGCGMDELVKRWTHKNKGYVITFNYTHTFENYLQDEDRSLWNVRHVHGAYDVVGNITDSIVLGVDKSMELDDRYNFLYKAHSNAFNNYHYSRYVNDSKHYIFYGLSFGKTDTRYFQRIFNQENKLYEIYYFGESELEEVRARIEDVSGILWDEFSDKNMVMMIDCEVDESRGEGVETIVKRREAAMLKYKNDMKRGN